MNRPKVLLITNIPAPYRVDLFYYMMKKVNEFELRVLYTNAGEDNRRWGVDEAKLINSTILESRVVKLRTRYDWRYVHFPKDFNKTIDKLNPDIIIGVEYNSAAIKSLKWARNHKIPYIHLTDGTLLSERGINIVQKLSRKYIIGKAQTYIASSTKAKEKLEYWGADSDKIKLSLLTTNIENYLWGERNPQKGRILYVGSTAERKGLDLLIGALSLVKSACELVVVGNADNAETEMLKMLASEKKVNIQWLGFKEGPELVEEYKKADIFVLPTREDCFGLVLVEAMAAGLPILSSKYADGAYDIIKSGVNGEMADPYDEVGFAKAIEDMLGNSDKYHADGDIIQKFQFESVSKAYIEAVRLVAHRG